MDPEGVIVRIAGQQDEQYAEAISAETERSAIERGSGISQRPASCIIQKMREGKAVIAISETGEWAGFSYIEVWSNGEFVSNSGLIVSPAFRGSGVAAGIKALIFELGRQLYPDARIFSITTGLAIMKMNARLGFEPVTFNEITRDAAFWEGCRSCVNFNILESKKCKNCLCTAMLYTPPVMRKSCKKGKSPGTRTTNHT
ncbi:MAG: N-acetyltransferase [Chitinophagaceae bacterium]|nr:N-acetyltransferase [Chitinophagaceae bacterium]